MADLAVEVARFTAQRATARAFAQLEQATLLRIEASMRLLEETAPLVDRDTAPLPRAEPARR